jgi:hypothetical protein
VIRTDKNYNCKLYDDCYTAQDYVALFAIGLMIVTAIALVFLIFRSSLSLAFRLRARKA